MNAIEPCDPSRLTEHQQALFAAVERRYGRVLAPVAVMAHNSAILDAMSAYEQAAMRTNALPPRLKHLVNLKAAALLGCPFCIDIGSHIARDAGVSDAAVRELPDFRSSKAFSPDEIAALSATEAMTLGSGELDDETWLQLRGHFDDAQLVELFATIAWENFRSRFNKAAGLQAQGFCPLGQRATAEVPLD